MDLTENMLRELSISIFGESRLVYQGTEYNFGAPFERMTVLDSVVSYNDAVTKTELADLDSIRVVAEKLGVHVEDSYGRGKILIEIFEKTVEPKLEGPVFITHYPAEVSPLARKCDDDPFVTERFEFFVAGREIANGFSELNDPEDQAERFRAQVAAKDEGDMEAMHFDEDYITALEYGMPPTAGEGIGIDRLVMLFTDAASIRDVLLFPQMKQKVS
jgi:lysyl-tRNA synthetase class 2